jgi:DNA adenine methylase
MLIRYPGSKDKHLVFLEPFLKVAEETRTVYEPFAGTASVTFYLLKKNMVDYYLINDIDASIAALWETVKKNPEKLIKKIKNYTPNVDDFYLFKKDHGKTVFDKAFRKLVLHQTSYSGLGAMAGGPLGGKTQSSKYKIDCRWYPNKLEATILECSRLLNSVEGEISSTSWDKAIDKAIDNDGFIYLDPPYYVKGEELYSKGTIDHTALAETLKKSRNFVLSYDDVPEIRKLYDWATIQKIDVRSHLHHKIITDVAIIP